MNKIPVLNWTSGPAGRPFLMLLACLVLLGSGIGPLQAANGPTVMKDRVFIGVHQTYQSWSPQTKKFVDKTTTWMPNMKFTVAGPIPGGSQLSVEFTKPGGRPWLKLDCPTEEVKENAWYAVSTPRETSIEFQKKYTAGTGVFGFKIRSSNELTGQNTVLLAGKFTVGKIPKGRGLSGWQNVVNYYVDHDWALPIGSVALYNAYSSSVPPMLTAWMWCKGEEVGPNMAGYVFYNGKQIASTKDAGVGATVNADLELNTITNDKGDPKWILWSFTWGIIGSKPDAPKDYPLYMLDKHPGVYTIKILRKGKLCRETSFTVGEGGKIIDTGIGLANNLIKDRVIVPVKVLGTTDGIWRKTAWATEAFYGNPLKGFAAP